MRTRVVIGLVALLACVAPACVAAAAARDPGRRCRPHRHCAHPSRAAHRRATHKRARSNSAPAQTPKPGRAPAPAHTSPPPPPAHTSPPPPPPQTVHTPAPTQTTPTPAPARVQVSAREFALTLSRPRVSAGPAVIEFVDAGQDPHDLHIRPAAGGSDVAAFGLGLPATHADQSITLAPGTYTLYCSLPGHEALGMHATLTVG